jgi:hypothetical protein
LPHARVIRDGRTCRCEREPASGALDTPAHGPRTGRAAPFAARPAEPRQRTPARLAELGAAPRAADASLREEEVQHGDQRTGCRCPCGQRREIATNPTQTRAPRPRIVRVGALAHPPGGAVLRR